MEHGNYSIHVDVESTIKMYNDIVNNNQKIREKDKIVKDSIEDNHTIDFTLLSEGKNIEDIIDDEYDGIPEENILMYQKFINNNMNI